MASVTVRIAGANGDGLESSGALLIKVANRSGLHVFGYRSYQSVIRGGHVWNQIRISDGALQSHGDRADLLVALNQDAIANQMGYLNKNAIVIYDPSKTNVGMLDASKFRLVQLPMLEIATGLGGSPVMRNMAAVGAVLGFLGIDMGIVNSVITDAFADKGQEVIDKNLKIASAGYGYSGISKAYDIKGDGKARYVIDGNSALAMGAFAAGCKFYAAYPMTPASGILHWFAEHEKDGAFFKQTEDELAAINMVIGAASAGVRAMCSTSGGGFSLMVEGLGLAGMLEVPIVVVDSQRIGPSTGLPTKTAQGDLLFLMHASQDEFPRIVVAPRNTKECFTIAANAFNLAERYQCPVLILMDMYISEHVESIDDFGTDKITIDRGKVVERSDGTARFKRYALTEDGISPRSLPGTPGLEFIATSYEHNEYGDLVSDVLAGLDEHVEMRRKMHEKRMRKIDTMLRGEDVFVPEVVNDGAKYHLVTFGSTAEPAQEAIEILRERGLDFGLISFSYIMPLDKEKTRIMLSGKTLIDVECNFTAQLTQVIRANTGIEITSKILKYDGEPITSKEIADRAEEIVKGVR